MMNRPSLLTIALLAVAACGGGQDRPSSPSAGADDPGDPGDPTAGDPMAPDPGAADAGAAEEPPEEEPAVTFEIKNSWDKELVFNLDAGWGATILVYSGKPPKAESVLPWAKHCTTSCETGRAERCPVCEKPESITEIRKSEKRETVAVGDTLEIGWDGQVHEYEKTKGQRGKGFRARCECYTMAPVPEASYTVRACGLRLSQEHKTKSTFQCVTVEDALTFPSEEPQRVVLDFGDPKPKKKAKKR